MPARLKLDDFDGPSFAPALAEAPANAEEIRLESYERGYSAGWEDAVAAQANDQARIREDLAQNLRDLSFTYQEARAHVLRGLEPLLRGMVARVLPDLARETFGESVAAALRHEAEALAGAPITLTISPANRPAIEAALAKAEALPVTILEEPTFADGQAYFRMGEEERKLDMDAVLAAIRALVTDFLDSPELRNAAHG
jgi:flagellar assembly protein FliH